MMTIQQFQDEDSIDKSEPSERDKITSDDED